MGFLDIKNVTKSYGNVEVLHRVDISVEEGEFLVLVGPSGCGKSTLLNMIDPRVQADIAKPADDASEAQE